MTYNNVSPEILEVFREKLKQKLQQEGEDTLQLSYDDIAEITGISKGTVYKAITRMEELGLLKVHRSHSRKFPNRYQLIEATEEGEPEPTSPEIVVGKMVVQLQREIGHLQRENERKSKILQKLEAFLGQDVLQGVESLVYRMADLEETMLSLDIQKGESLELIERKESGNNTIVTYRVNK